MSSNDQQVEDPEGEIVLIEGDWLVQLFAA
jgi:hypothetical protein